MDIINIFSTVTNIIFSFVSIVSAIKANRDAKKTNMLAEKKLKEVQKDYLPILIFDGNLEYVQSISEEVVYDFREDEQDEEILLIKTKVKNIGKGIIRKVSIKSLIIFEGNKREYDKLWEKMAEIPMLVCIDNRTLEEEFVLSEQEKQDIIFLINRRQMRWGHCDGLEQEDIYLCMEIEIFSTNETSYDQKASWCNFRSGKPVQKSFDNVAPKLRKSKRDN